jgi:hypothetical protein
MHIYDVFKFEFETRIPSRIKLQYSCKFEWPVYRVSQKNRKLLKSLIVKIECPTKKVHVLKFS